MKLLRHDTSTVNSQASFYHAGKQQLSFQRLQAKPSDQVPQSNIVSWCYVKDIYLPCSRTPRIVTAASRSTWFLMSLTVDQTPGRCDEAGAMRQLLSSPFSCPPTAACSTTASSLLCSNAHFLHHTLTLSTPHHVPKATSHQKPSCPDKCLLLNHLTAIRNSCNYIYSFCTLIEFYTDGDWKVMRFFPALLLLIFISSEASKLCARLWKLLTSLYNLMTRPSALIPSSRVDHMKDILDFSSNNLILLLGSEFLKEHSGIFILLIDTERLPRRSVVLFRRSLPLCSFLIFLSLQYKPFPGSHTKSSWLWMGGSRGCRNTWSLRNATLVSDL